MTSVLHRRLANKQDHIDALDEIDVADRLQLEMLANECQTPTRIEICSATQGTGKNIDPIIRIGFQYDVIKVCGCKCAMSVRNCRFPLPSGGWWKPY